jgi:hypothetical protein
MLRDLEVRDLDQVVRGGVFYGISKYGIWMELCAVSLMKQFMRRDLLVRDLGQVVRGGVFYRFSKDGIWVELRAR